MGSPVRTRTVAIIKTHALEHRFEIEQRISEAGFEIVKERQMEFDTETDPDTLFELFGDDYVSFAEGPVWVYVLERRRAVEVWHTLMGDPDPEVARQETTNSLRALYGIDSQQNGLMGSPNVEIAEIQIQAIFASSPPFPPTDLPDVGEDLNLRNGYYATSSANSSSGKAGFRARPLPSTHDKPDIVPRMSRAAALRAGVLLEKPKHVPASKESIAKTFANVPGHKRAEVIQVASTAPPVVAPRMTRAASLRLGIKPEPKPARRASSANVKADAKATFDGVPGHKRRESIPVASVKPPTVAPRSNRSASLRLQKESAPPSSFMFRTPTTQSRSSSRASMNGSESNATPSRRPSVSSSRPASAASVRQSHAPPSSFSRKSISTGGPLTQVSNGNHKVESKGPTPPPKPTLKAPRPSSLGVPTIAPRPNKSALLRAQKMAATAAANDKKTSAVGVKKVGVAPKSIRT
ncbi:hypothetical protein C8Q75DRAFT_720259 [Abortiporus biennis]|nr:hypothetical protein C8Q75DRAFT_720259 [Abortiporus biennis]